MKYKEKYSILKPEDIVLFNRYSFSFNPEDQPKPQRFYSITLNLFTSWAEQIYNMFVSLRYCEVETYMEISKSSRLHFHGYIKINDIFNFYFYDLPKIKHYGTLEIDHIKDPLVWDLYIKKQKSFCELFCAKHNIIYHFNGPDRTDAKTRHV